MYKNKYRFTFYDRLNYNILSKAWFFSECNSVEVLLTVALNPGNKNVIAT